MIFLGFLKKRKREEKENLTLRILLGNLYVHLNTEIYLKINQIKWIIYIE